MNLYRSEVRGASAYIDAEDELLIFHLQFAFRFGCDEGIGEHRSQCFVDAAIALEFFKVHGGRHQVCKTRRAIKSADHLFTDAHRMGENGILKPHTGTDEAQLFEKF